MTHSTRRRRRLWSAPILFIVLAITTGWGQATTPVSPAAQSASLSLPASASTGRASDDVVVASRNVEAAFMGAPFRQHHPERTFAAPRPTVAAHVASVATVTPAAKSSPYTGRNHVWIPALGISRPVYLFACTRKRAPDNLVYRWGCAGHNNVYLLGHAYGVFKPLHDAYVTHRLHVGMVAIYADGNGRIRRFKVTTWRVVDPSDSNWAVASQPVPSMTLQTCVGPSGSLRLNVRLIAVN